MNPSADPIALARQLIQQASVTPNDADCQKIIADYLAPLGYRSHNFDQSGVCNRYYARDNSDPLLWYVGHTDVVPPGDLSQWSHPPFAAVIHQSYLYGRGAVDMKGGIACFLTALTLATRDIPELNIGILITSDEEGPAKHGIKAMLPLMQSQGMTPPRFCLVGEPSSKDQIGDTIKIGRRGSLTAHITVTGKQGHVAYPQLAMNPIHAITESLQVLQNTEWDHGNAHFDSTQCQVVAIESDTKTSNLIPNQVLLTLNFRYSPEINASQLQEKVETIFNKHCVQKHNAQIKLDWHHSGLPFYTPPGQLVKAMTDAIHAAGNSEVELSTSGGTSDGRFIAPLGCEVIEMGLLNKTIHQINERTSVDDLHALVKIYRQFLTNLYKRTMHAS